MNDIYIKNRKNFLTQYYRLRGYVFWREHGTDEVEVKIAKSPDYVLLILDAIKP